MRIRARKKKDIERWRRTPRDAIAWFPNGFQRATNEAKRSEAQTSRANPHSFTIAMFTSPSTAHGDRASFASRSFSSARATSKRASPRSRRAALAPRCETAGSVRREVLKREDRAKLDRSPDSEFYAQPRFVTHVDDDFLANVTELYRRRIPPRSKVLDLCSSWVSHLPRDVEYGKVYGHGMNASELGRNERLDSFFVRDFNVDPRIALENNSVDAVVCCVSVQYLQRAEEVFAEIFRVLKPGGVVIITFSNRLFYSKAIQAWRDASGYARVQLVKSYFSAVAGFTAPEVITELGARDETVLGKIRRFFQRSAGDPFYAVVAYANYKPVYEEGDCVRMSSDGDCIEDFTARR